MFIRWGHTAPRSGLGRAQFLATHPDEVGERCWEQHRPPEGVVGVYAFPDADGLRDRFLVPEDAMREAFGEDFLAHPFGWERANAEIADGVRSHATVFSAADVRAIWARFGSDGRDVEGTRWHRYATADAYLDALCRRGDDLIVADGGAEIGKGDWPFAAYRDYAAEEVFLELAGGRTAS